MFQTFLLFSAAHQDWQNSAENTINKWNRIETAVLTVVVDAPEETPNRSDLAAFLASADNWTPNFLALISNL